MKIILAFVLLFMVTVFGQDFRNSYWGDSYNKVKSSEKEGTIFTPFCDDETLAYLDVELADVKVFVLYYFVDNKLVRGVYGNDEKHSTKNSYILDFNSFTEGLTAKYGEGSHEVIWADDLYQNSPADYGLAISIGHVSIFNTWKTPTSIITNYIYGADYNITHALEYMSKKYNEKYDQHQKEKELKKF